MEIIDILQVLVQYGIAGVALYMLYDITKNKLTNIDSKLALLNEKLDDVKEELIRVRTAFEKRGKR